MLPGTNPLMLSERANKPHIIHILGTLGMGGAQAMVLRLATHPELQDYRHSIVCVIARQGEFLEVCAEYGIPVYECPLRWPTSTPIPSYHFNKWLRNHLYFTFPRRMAHLLKRIDASLVHTHVTAKVSLQAQAVLQRADMPWIWTLHGLYRSRGEDTSDWKRTVDLINRSSGAITAVSQAALDELSAEAVLDSCRSSVIPNGIDASEFSPSLNRDPAWRRQWNIPSDAVVFGAAGRLIDVKRHVLFIEAASELVGQEEAAHFVIAGEGPLRKTLEEHIQELGLASRFHLVGYQADMPRFLREIDVMVLSSASEGFGNTLIEACATGVPCVATAVGGVPEILQNGAGILVEPGSSRALVEAMKCMLRPEVRAGYAEQTRAVAEHYSIDAVSKQYDVLYRGLLSE